MSRNQLKADIKPSLATHFPSLVTVDDVSLDVHMFTEDVCTGVMPIGGRRHKQKAFSVEFLGGVRECEKAMETLSCISDSDRYDPAKTVCDVVNEIARHMAWEGLAVFEILDGGECVYISSITSKCLFRIFNWYLQIIPSGDRVLWNRKFSFVASSKVWEVEMPTRLGGMRGYKKTLDKLRKYSGLDSMLYRSDFQEKFASHGFDFLKHEKYRRICVNTLTKSWGWNRRDWSQESCTEFYSFHRLLRFRYSQALLREHIIAEINQLLQRLNIKCELMVTGLPSPNDILRALDEMQKGEISFSEASDKVTV